MSTHLQIDCRFAGRIVSGLLLLLASRAFGVDSPDFRIRIAPVLEAKCVSCHRPDNAKGAFDLTSRAGMLKGGEEGPAITPGKPDESAVFTRSIPHGDAKAEMPKKGDPLTSAEVAALRDWIAAGAPWPNDVVLTEKAKADKTFWSFLPLSKVQPPRADDAPLAWRTNPIDRFIYAKLNEQGLKPNSPAEPRVFIRRATYDLLGLPPAPEEVEAFTVAFERDAESAVASLIDRLLASPHYGERWGRHWLDVVRFGESRGFERNQIITNIWPFRDYVIRSLNDDKPFDQFMREHLAGDVIGKGQPDVEIGSAFLVAGPYDDVGNQDPIAAAQIRADQMDEMIRATSEAFLGVTLGCARCHDHKFDPLLTKDYYALYAAFAGTVHGERELATVEQVHARAEKLKPLETRKAVLLEQQKALDEELAERAKASEPAAAKKWIRPRITRYGTEESFSPLEAKHVRLTIEAADASDGKGKSQQAKLDEFEVWTNEATPRNVALASAGGRAVGDAREAGDFAGAYGASLTIDGKFGERWHAGSRDLTITLAKVERINRVLFSSDRNRGLPEDSGISTFVGEYELAASLDGKVWTKIASSHDRKPATATIKEHRLLEAVTTAADRERVRSLKQGIAAIDAEMAKVPALPVLWVGTHKDAAGPFHVFPGGNTQRKGEAVVPASLSVFNERPSSYRLDLTKPESDRRLALANWITASDNPLTPRVLANRVWHYHFGKGIVDTPSDFGFMGSRPTHPELLDWLALQLQSGGWKWKGLHRLIMTSQTYRQSGTWNQVSAHVDSDSRLLWRFPPRRLSAEEVRDSVLSVAGRLDLRMGGPGFKLYEYLQDNVATYVPLDRHGPETYRRAVYHHNARAARVDVMTEFDCPDPSFAEPRRASTTTPLQALTLMNHSFALDMATALAGRLQREAGCAEQQVCRAFELCYGRQAAADEVTGGIKLVESHGLRAFCRALLNSNELLTVN